MDTSLETSSQSGVKLPWEIGGRENEDPIRIVPDAVHLNEKLGFHARGVLFIRVTCAAQGVDFIDEDNGRLALASFLENCLDEPGKPCLVSTSD